MGAPEARTLGRELSLTAKLGGPLALGELGWMSTYIVDALMIARLPHSALSIAASSLGNTIYYAIAFFVIYLMNGLETFVSQAYGRGDNEECARMLAQSFWIVLLGTPLVMLLTLGSLALLPHFGTPPEIVAETRRYLSALVWGTAPLLLYMALRRYLQSMNRVILISISLVTASAVNLVGDWAFLYGHLGMPAMGVAGSGWGTCVVRLWMVAMLLLGTVLAFRSTGQRLHFRQLRPDWPRLKGLLQIGWPAGLEFSTELGISTYMSILCARFGTTLLAAHQVTLDLNAFVYMVPTGLAYAAMIRVGQGAGRNNLGQVRRSMNAALVLGLGFTVVAAAIFVGFAHTWAGLYTNDPAVVNAAVPLFMFCGFILIGDASFVLFSSALTGLGDTRSAMMVSIAMNWILGMPLAYWLAFTLGRGVYGLWLGRAIGSAAGGFLMAAIWHAKLRRRSEGSRATSLALFPSFSAKQLT